MGGAGGRGADTPLPPPLPPKCTPVCFVFFGFCFFTCLFSPFSCVSSILDYNHEQGNPRCGSILLPLLLDPGPGGAGG